MTLHPLPSLLPLDDPSRSVMHATVLAIMSQWQVAHPEEAEAVEEEVMVVEGHAEVEEELMEATWQQYPRL